MPSQMTASRCCKCRRRTSRRMRSSASVTWRRPKNPLVCRASSSSVVMRSSSAGCGRVRLLGRALAFGVANQFIEANRHGLPQIHGDIFIARGNPNEPVAMAEIFVGKAKFLRAKQQRDATGPHAPANQPRGIFRAVDRVLQFTIADRRGSHDQRAIGHGVGDALEMLRLRQNFGSANGRARFPKGGFERIYHAQRTKSKVAHGASRRADVQGIARGHEDYMQTVELKRRGQEVLFYRLAGCKWSLNLCLASCRKARNPKFPEPANPILRIKWIDWTDRPDGHTMGLVKQGRQYFFKGDSYASQIRSVREVS